MLLEDADARIAPGEPVLVTGPSGSGKSTLFRAVAGIWPFGRGRVRLPAGARTLFLPQRPYLPLGTLRRALCYPWRLPACRTRRCGRRCATPASATSKRGWTRRTPGTAGSRAASSSAWPSPAPCCCKPDWLFLDEATASLDPEAEAAFYTLLSERLPDAAMVSIAHRPAVARFHDRALRLRDRRLVEAPA